MSQRARWNLVMDAGMRSTRQAQSAARPSQEVTLPPDTETALPRIGRTTGAGEP